MAKSEGLLISILIELKVFKYSLLSSFNSKSSSDSLAITSSLTSLFVPLNSSFSYTSFLLCIIFLKSLYLLIAVLNRL